MKVSKKSLLMSIAVLCVCAISLTAASYAWFSASQTAEVTSINLSVKKASDLQVSLDGKSWSTSVEHKDAEAPISDASCGTGTSFWAPAVPDDVDNDTGAYNGTYTAKSEGVKAVTVYFRSSSPVNVLVAMDKFATLENQKQGILPAMRMLSVADSNLYFSNDSLTEKYITAADGTLSGDITTNPANTSVEILAALSDKYSNSAVTIEDGFFYGEATFYFYVEGTHPAAINANTGVNFVQGLTFTTTYEAE